MKVERSGTAKVQKVFVTEIPSLDPVTVYFDDIREHVGQITVICFGEAWTAYFGAMPKEDLTVESFFRTADSHYMTNALIRAQFTKQTKQHEKYLMRIVEAVRQALNQERTVPA